MDQVALLNNDYRFLGAIPLRKALKLVVKKKAQVVKYGEEVVYDPSKAGNMTLRTSMLKPKVLRLLHLVKQFLGKLSHRTHTKAQYNKKYVYLRDDNQCGYCQDPANTIDHILPQSRKGQTTYENTVACCTRCNDKKKNRTPQEAGMRLLKKPYAPSVEQITQWRQRELALKLTFDYSTLFA